MTNVACRFGGILFLFLLQSGIVAQNIIYMPPVTEGTITGKTIDTNLEVGAIAGSHGVSATGGATYTIPIFTPPGSNGHKPALSLNYNSQSGDGLLGWGWSVSGLSSINRVGSDHYHDGTAAPVSYTEQDHVALDGQRLVPTNGGAYWGADTKYDTERAQWLVVSTPELMPDDVPDHFEVRTKDGMRMRYGYFNGWSTSKLYNPDHGVVAWLLSNTVDAFGNEIHYEYVQDENGIRIDRINWCNAVALQGPGVNRIEFKYKQRTDITGVWLHGRHYVNKHLLEEVKVIGAGQLVRTYLLKYAQGDLGRSYLSEIVEHGREGDPLNSTIFKYGEDPAAPEVEVAPLGASGGQNFVGENVDLFAGDFDGNGRSDVMAAWWYYLGNGSKVHSSFSVYLNGDMSSTPFTVQLDVMYPGWHAQMSGYRLGQGFHCADYNGDGRDDIAVSLFHWHDPSSAYFFSHVDLWTSDCSPDDAVFTLQPIGRPDTNPEHGDAFSFLYTPPGESLREFMFIGDFTGDGRADLLAVLFDDTWFPGVTGSDMKVSLWEQATGQWMEQTLSTAVRNHLVGCASITPLDFNGDGKLEIMTRYESGSSACMVSGNVNGNWNTLTTSSQLTYTDFNDVDEFEMALGDFNGDRYPDILKREGVTFSIYFSIGESWAGPYAFSLNSTFASNNSKVVVGDFNGDGISDVFHGHEFSGSDAIAYGRGYGPAGPTFEWHDINYSPAITHLTLGDFNADGRTDMLNRHFFQAPVDIINFRPGGTERSLDKIADGFLNVVDFDYGLTSQAALYTESDQEYAYPAGDFDMPMTVVEAVHTPNGIGGLATDTYGYGDGHGWRNGGGFCGFRRFSTGSTASDRSSLSTFAPLSQVAGLFPTKTEVSDVSTGTLLQTSNYSGGAMLLGSQMRRHTLQVLQEANINGLSGIVTTKTNQFNTTGDNILSTTTVVTGIATTTEVYDYDAYGPDWPDEMYDNRLVTHTVTSTRNGQVPLTGVTEYEYEPYTGALTLTREYANTAVPVLHEIESRTSHGNVEHERYYHQDPYGAGEREATYTYDQHGRGVIEKVVPVVIDGSEYEATTGYEHDLSLGVLLAETGSDGLKVSHRYDQFGSKEGEQAPHLNGQERYEVLTQRNWEIGTIPGAVYSVTTDDPGGPRQIAYYDRLGRVIETWKEGFVEATWSKSRTVYDAQGRVYSTTDPALDGEVAYSTTMTYDPLGRLDQSDHSLTGSTMITYAYENGLERTITTDPAGRANTIWKDGTGLTVKAQDHGGILDYTYDSRGEVIKIKHGPLTVINLTYDDHGQRTSLTDISAGTIEYRYDPFGQLAWQKSANDDEQQLFYDKLGRLVRTIEPEGEIIHRYYKSGNSIGNQPTEISGFGTTKNYEYDNLMRLDYAHLESPEGDGAHKIYHYDAFDRLAAIEYDHPFALALIREYTPSGYLDKVRDGNTEHVYFDAIDMDGSGHCTNYALADGVTTEKSYTGGFLQGIIAGTVQQVQYTWDHDSGDLMERWDVLKKRKDIFTYDQLDRLTRARTYKVNQWGVPTGLISDLNYGYDAGPGISRGNMTVKTDVGKFGYSSGHAIVSAVHNAFPVPPDTPPSVINLGKQAISYTSFHQPANIYERIGADEFELNYTYGPDHQRVYSVLQFLDDEIIEERLYDGEIEHQLEWDANLTRHIVYVEGGDGLCAIVVAEGDMGDQIERYAVYKDHLGSIVAITQLVEEELVIVAEQNFDAWGRARNPITWTYNGLPELPKWLYRGYTGHEHVEPFALINMNGRMYDPVNGRMLSVDNYVQGSTSTQAFNRYSYAFNNPLKYTDPSGEIGHIVIGALIGGIINLGVKIYQGKIHDLGDGIAAFGIGAAAGAVAAATGGAAFLMAGGAAGGAGGFLAGAAAGAVGAAYASPIQSMGNALYFKDPFMTPKEYVTGIATGAALSGFVNGTIATIHGRNFIDGTLPGANVAPTYMAPRDVIGHYNKSYQGPGELRVPNQLAHYTVDDPSTWTSLGRVPDRIVYLTNDVELGMAGAQSNLALQARPNYRIVFNRTDIPNFDMSRIELVRPVTGNVFNQAGGGWEVMYRGPIELPPGSYTIERLGP